MQENREKPSFELLKTGTIVLTWILFIVIGFIQLFAIASGIKVWLEIESTAIAFLIAILTTFIPIVGNILGILGAIQVWGWSFLLAISLFFGWAIFYLLMSLSIGIICLCAIAIRNLKKLFLS